MPVVVFNRFVWDGVVHLKKSIFSDCIQKFLPIIILMFSNFTSSYPRKSSIETIFFLRCSFSITGEISSSVVCDYRKMKRSRFDIIFNSAL